MNCSQLAGESKQECATSRSLKINSSAWFLNTQSHLLVQEHFKKKTPNYFESWFWRSDGLFLKVQAWIHLPSSFLSKCVSLNRKVEFISDKLFTWGWLWLFYWMQDWNVWMILLNGWTCTIEKCRMWIRRKFIGVRCISWDVVFPYRRKPGQHFLVCLQARLDEVLGNTVKERILDCRLLGYSSRRWKKCGRTLWDFNIYNFDNDAPSNNVSIRTLEYNELKTHQNEFTLLYSETAQKKAPQK